MLTPEVTLQKLKTLEADRARNNNDWDKLHAEQDTAQALLDARFTPRWETLTAQEDEFEFLDHILVIDSHPLYYEDDRGLHTLRTLPSPTSPRRIAMFTLKPALATLSLNQEEGDYRYFRFDTDEISVVRNHAYNWLLEGVLPPLAYEITRQQLHTPPPPDSTPEI